MYIKKFLNENKYYQCISLINNEIVFEKIFQVITIGMLNYIVRILLIHFSGRSTHISSTYPKESSGFLDSFVVSTKLEASKDMKLRLIFVMPSNLT